MEHIKAHIGKILHKKEKVTERGELLEYFCDRLNRTRLRDGYPPLTIARMAKVLQLIPTKDLYYLKSVCEQASDFSKRFWWEVNPKKHTDEVPKNQKPFRKKSYKKYGEQ